MKKNQVKLSKLSPERSAKSKVIAVMNNKGGCGKTTTAIAIGLHLVRSGYNVLFWDNDPQSNLTQRLGLPDGKHDDKRIDFFFRNSDLDAYERTQRKQSLVIKYPYIYRLKGSETPPGNVGIMAGSHYSEIDANAAASRLDKKTYLDHDNLDIFKYFRSGARLYCDYYDYIIMDTAPALEGNLLNKLAVRTADEIICPIDGLDAAQGVKTFLTWVKSETRAEYVGNKTSPNCLFAMVKYQQDTGEVAKELVPDLRMRNAVYRVMKMHFGDFVCDHGVSEKRKLRSYTPGFGRKTDYDELCSEIFTKISMKRPYIFDVINQEGFFAKFEDSLSKIEEKTQTKRPTFKTPFYEKLNGVNVNDTKT